MAHNLNSVTHKKKLHLSLHITVFTCEFCLQIHCIYYWYALLEFTLKLQNQQVFMLTHRVK